MFHIFDCQCIFRFIIDVLSIPENRRGRAVEEDKEADMAQAVRTHWGDLCNAHDPALLIMPPHIESGKAIRRRRHFQSALFVCWWPKKLNPIRRVSPAESWCSRVKLTIISRRNSEGRNSKKHAVRISTEMKSDIA